MKYKRFNHLSNVCIITRDNIVQIHLIRAWNLNRVGTDQGLDEKISKNIHVIDKTVGKKPEIEKGKTLPCMPRKLNSFFYELIRS